MARRGEHKSQIQIQDLDMVSATEAKNRFGDLLHRVVYDHEPVLIVEVRQNVLGVELKTPKLTGYGFITPPLGH